MGCGSELEQWVRLEILQGLLLYSLFRKPIPIQGTGVILDTPDAIHQWIEDRRKRWPTSSRVEEKTKKLQEAVARGEIAATEMGLKGRKRQMAGDHTSARGQKKMRGKSREMPQDRRVHPLPMKPQMSAPSFLKNRHDEDSGSNSDVDPEKDAISSKRPVSPVAMEGKEDPGSKSEPIEEIPKATDAVNNIYSFAKLILTTTSRSKLSSWHCLMFENHLLNQGRHPEIPSATGHLY